MNKMKRKLRSSLTIFLLVSSSFIIVSTFTPMIKVANASSTTIYAETSDNYIYYTNADWNNTRDASSGTLGNVILNYKNLAMSVNTDYEIYRSFFMFDTSSVPSNSTITNVYLNVFGYSNADSSVCVMKGTQGDALASDEFGAFEGSEYGHILWSASQYNNISFNSQGLSDINKTGITYICCREYEHDYLNSTPSSAFSNGCYYANRGGGYAPYLVVCYYITNTPIQSNENPTNSSTDVSRSTTLSINISDADGDNMNITWLIYNSGWVEIGSNNSVSNGTYTCSNTSLITSSNTTYYYRVLVSDGTATSNETYHFTTSVNDIPTATCLLPNSGCDIIPPLLRYNISDPEGDLMNITILYNDSGSWVTLKTYTSVGNGTYNTTNTSLMNSYDTTYYHRLLVYDGYSTFNTTYQFTTNTVPNQTSEIPINGSTEISPQPSQPTLSINISDADGDNMNITWLINNSGWVEVGSNNSVSNGTYTCSNTSLLSGYLTTYYYRILVVDLYQTTNETYHFTTRDNLEPSLGTISPSNDTNVSIADTVTLSWSATDADNHSITYTVYWGASGSSDLLLSNTTSTSLNLGTLDAGTYEWNVTAYDEMGASNTSSTLTLNVLNMTYDCNVWLKHEEDFTNYALKEKYTYTLKVFFDNRTCTYSISNNGFSSSINYSWGQDPEYMRLLIFPNDTSGYIDYYRGRIPVDRDRIGNNYTYNITFFVPKNESTLARYTFTLDDRSGNFRPPDTWIRIYNYNETGDIGYIHEDYFTVDLTMTAYLLYNSRYYNQIRNGDVIYQDNRIIDASDVTEQTIIIYPYLPDMLSFYWDIVELAGYHDGNNIMFSYVDNHAVTQWVNISIYESYNGTDTLIYSTNLSGNTITMSLGGYNTSRYHYIDVFFNHNELGTKTVRLRISPGYDNPISPGDVEAYIVFFLGTNPIGTWLNIIAGLVIMAVVLIFTGKEYAFMGPISAALVIFLLQRLIGFNGINSTVAGFLGIIGIMGALRRGGK